MKTYTAFALLGLLVAAGGVQAEVPQCEANYKQEGNFFGGRRFTTWGDVPTAPAAAYKLIYAEMVKSGLKVTNADREMGILNASQTANLDGKAFELPWNVVIEPKGKGSRITVSKMTPGGYATGADFQKRSMCAVVATADKA